MTSAHQIVADHLSLQEQGNVLRLHLLETTLMHMDDTPTRAALAVRVEELRMRCGIHIPIDRPPRVPPFIAAAVADAERQPLP